MFAHTHTNVLIKPFSEESLTFVLFRQKEEEIAQQSICKNGNKQSNHLSVTVNLKMLNCVIWDMGGSEGSTTV